MDTDHDHVKLSTMEIEESGGSDSSSSEKSSSRGIYCRKSQIAAFVVLAVLLIVAVGLLAGLLPQRDVPSKEPINATPEKPEPTMMETTKMPQVTTKMPQVTTKMPQVTTKMPQVTTKMPQVTTKMPQVTTKMPQVTTKMPQVTTKMPQVTTKMPQVTTVQPTTPVPCNDPWCPLRLPSAVYPEHYKLLLYPNLDTANFTGTVDIDIVVKEAIKFPRLHFKEMIILSSEIRPAVDSGSTPAPPLAVARPPFEYVPNQFYVMEMAQDLQPGNYVWSLEFQGYLQPNRVGFYLSTYTNDKGEQRKMATSKFEPTDARRAFPCFDEPNLKANYTTTLVHPEAPYIALSNMNNVSTTQYPLNTSLWQTEFATSVKMSTYLACFIVCDFQYKEKLLDTGVPFRVYAPPYQIDQVDYALEVGVNVTNYFEDYFDLAYPLPKLDMIAIPDFTSGAMEHWGLITYREVYLLYSDTESSEANKQRIAEVVAHELAHQWFGNIVTMDWWDDLWLNEGFASYVEYLGVDFCHPDWQKMNQFLNQDFFYVMGNDQIVSSHPIIVDLQNPDQINEVFDSIPYSKGASVLRMLNYIVGEDVFKQGVANYLKKYEYGNAVSDDLWREIASVSEEKGDNIDVKYIMDSWTLQMGFPVVTLNKTVDAEVTFDVQQEWFLVNPEADKSEDLYGSKFNYTWNIPFNTYFESNTSDVVPNYMPYTGVTFDRRFYERDNWYVANYGNYGFYRVNYDTNNWNLLNEQLVNNHTVIDIRNRAGLLDDAFNLARAEMIDYDIPLDLTKYLVQEEEYTPWDAAYDGIIYLREMLRFRPAYAKLRKYFAAQAKPMLDKLTWEDTGSHMEKYLRSDIIYMSCGFGDTDCLDQAVTRFRDYLAGTSVPVNIRRQAYRFGMEEEGDQDAWDYLWDMYMNSTVSTEKTNLRYAMARTRQVWLLARYLEYCRDDTKIRSQDFFSTLDYIAGNPVGNPLVWDWVRANYDYLLERFGVSDRYLGRLIPGFTDYWNTEQKLKELEDFWAEYPDAGAGARGRLQAVERIKTNIKWMAKNEDIITKWLDDNM